MLAIEALKAALPSLSYSDASFANSLLAQFERKGDLSPKQWPWVEKLAAKASQPEAPKAVVGDLSGVLALFTRAAKHLKRPSIVLHVPDLGEIRINVAGSHARVPGSLNVAMNDRSEWFGRITADGTFEQNRKLTTLPTELLPTLREFALRPAEVAASHGKLTGKCCFCNTGLSDQRSTDVGYGPTCADHFGLAWGNKRRGATAAPSLFCDALA